MNNYTKQQIISRCNELERKIHLRERARVGLTGWGYIRSVNDNQWSPIMYPEIVVGEGGGRRYVER